MKKPIGYYILLVLTWPMQFFPLAFHFLFADLLFIFIYRVFGYRKKVVAENLEKSFPLKSGLERKIIERKFYRNFADIFIETLYFSHIPLSKAGDRLKVENLELIVKLLGDGKNVILVAGHLGNWEYFQLFKPEFRAQRFFVYKHLGSKTFDQFFLRSRSRSKAAAPLEMKEVYRKLHAIAKSGNQYIALMISDQRPLRGELSHWVTFLNQDTPVFTGTERIARKTNAAVVYSEITQIKRGYQKLRFDLITENPSEYKEFELTNEFMAKLEQSINTYPDQYFWTHKRWKYKREMN